MLGSEKPVKHIRSVAGGEEAVARCWVATDLWEDRHEPD